MSLVYRIKGWDTIYEVAQSRKIRGPLNWLALPTVDDAYPLLEERVLAEPDGAELLGIMYRLLRKAARMPRRGVLADRNGPLSAELLAELVRTSPAAMERFIKVFSAAGVGWLESEPWRGFCGLAGSVVGARWEQSGSLLPIQTDIQTMSDRRSIDDQIDRTDAAAGCASVAADKLRAASAWGEDPAIRERATAIRRKIAAVLLARSEADGLLIGQMAIAVAIELVSESLLFDALEGVRRTANVRKPFGLFLKLVQQGCERERVPFSQLTVIKIPESWKRSA